MKKSFEMNGKYNYHPIYSSNFVVFYPERKNWRQERFFDGVIILTKILGNFF
jgi:hypothetical protein